MTLVKTTAHVTEAIAHLVEQYKRSPNMQAFISAFATQIQDLENAFFEIFEERWIDTAVGIQLDGLGAIVGEDREGRGDDAYRLAIKARIQINASETTPEDILTALVNFYTATYQMSELGFVAFIIRFVGVWTEGMDPDPEDFLSLLNQINGAGIAAWFQWSEYEDDNVFTFSSSDTEEASTTQGFGEDPEWVIIRSASSPQTAHSVDRESWSTAAAAQSNSWNEVDYCERLVRGFVAFANSGTNRAMDTIDGSSWATLLPSAARWTAAAWSKELRLLAVVGTDSVASVFDGVSWEDSSIPTRSFISMAWSPSLRLFCAVAPNTTTIITSPDGRVWTERTGFNAESWQGICWSEEKGLFVAIADTGGGGGTLCQTSPDGITWTGRTVTLRNWKSIVWSKRHGLFIAVGATSGWIITSPDGITWTEYNIGIASSAYSVVEFGGQILALGTAAGVDQALYTDNIYQWKQTAIVSDATPWVSGAFGAPTGGFMSEIIGG